MNDGKTYTIDFSKTDGFGWTSLDVQTDKEYIDAVAKMKAKGWKLEGVTEKSDAPLTREAVTMNELFSCE
jgi:hypothetical protein